MPRFTFIDLFAGIGGMRLGFEAAGGACVFTSEWDKYCRLTYESNFGPQQHYAGDIRRIDPADMPDFDVLLAGFPCQPFSIAGVSKKNALGRPHGFDDEAQGNLFFQIARILSHHRPTAFLLENVRNLKSHDGGRTYDVIRNTLEHDLGYFVSDRVIDARSWVPQHRERVFIVGFRDDVGFDLQQMPLPDGAAAPRLKTVLHDLGEEADGVYVLPNGRVNPKYTLSSHLWAYLQEYADKHRRKGNGFGFGVVTREDISRTLSARYYKDGSEILVKGARRARPRRLTPRECSRLMGFDKPGGREWAIPVSDTQAYKQFGNAVVPPVVEAIAEYMQPYLQRAISLRRAARTRPATSPLLVHA